MTEKRSTDGSSGRDEIFTTEDAIKLYTERVQDSTLFPAEQKAVERYFTDPNASVLDVGCGVGRVSHLLDERGFDVTGIDISQPMIEKARSLFPNLDFQVADIRNTTFNSGAFDYVVFSYYGLDYILPKAERVKALREIYRVLRPAGIIVFSSHNSWYKPLRRVAGDFIEHYFEGEKRGKVFSRYKIDSVPLGEVEVYLSNPVHQWLQLRKCGFTLLNVTGESEGRGRFFERDPHYVAKK
ncbi:class I SAM-dependent methyltransferase (plasmid) [Halorussus limi]|uniref:Class I SAM-dependent methyltransferase n=1 Tax=Halorussus limi TaxID=2938695 RepID=A0A8U0I167_9EURY|nr:class I SAM-dependent methyltransferase [Halorussus limi]UPV76631.1 class I SAM-dependent methyltransferase [Halorussus limi]